MRDFLTFFRGEYATARTFLIVAVTLVAAAVLGWWIGATMGGWSAVVVAALAGVALGTISWSIIVNRP